MENRRQDYRHPFSAGPRPTAELTRPGRAASQAGDVMNLSVGGMAVRLVDAGADWKAGEPCQVALALPGQPERLSLQAAVVHLPPAGGGTVLGLRFLPLASPAANDRREQALWLFLLDEQRRQRRAVAQGRRAV